MFYFGSETPESSILKSGIVTYKDNSSRYDNVIAQVKNIGKTELIADFENKKIKGELKIDGLRRNTVAGKATFLKLKNLNTSFSAEQVK